MRFTVKAKTFSTLVRACAVACSPDNEREKLQHIELVVKDGVLIGTCLDGFRLIQKTINVTNAEDGKCLVKPKHLVNALTGTKNDVLVTLDGDYLQIGHDFGIVALRRFDGDFIDYEAIWPSVERKSTQIWVNAKYLAEVAKSMVSDSDLGVAVIGLDIPLNPVHPIVITKNDGKALVLPIRHH